MAGAAAACLAHASEPRDRRRRGFMMAKILLVEDNELNRDMLSRRLARRGFDVVVAIDGSSGAAAAITERPDLILMDLSLPDMDGCEVTRLIHADTATASIPVIALTAHAMDTDRLRAIDAGCQDYDTKPVDLTRLLAKIDALLSRHE
jgi:CheY-like chemotaxis protein